MKAVFLLLFLLLGGALVGGYYFNELDYPAPEEKTITVAKGANIRSLAADLQAQGQIRSAWVLVVHGYQSGLSGRLQPGTYVYGRGMKAPEFLRAVSKGKALSYSLAVIEGRTFADLLASLRQHPQLVQTLGDRSPAEIARLLKLPTNPEGLFLPATYSFKPGTSDVQLLRQMHQHLQDYLAKAWAQRDPNLPLKTPYEALILASLVEKETGVASERPQIAGIFIRRLQQKMKLQTDPSVIYGAADYQGVITKAHLQTDTPYNTYTRAGLPPTPIALASKASIEAVLHPAPGTALFFVADGSGGHKFSTTYEEHKAAVKAYRAWQQQRAKASTTPSPTVEGSASPTAPASPTAGPAGGSASDRKATTAGPALRPGANGANPNAGSASTSPAHQPAPSATAGSASAPPAHQQAPTAGSASAPNANPTATSMPSTAPGVRPKATNQMSAGDASSQNDNPPANQIAPAGSASAPNAHQPAPSATSGSASTPNGNPTAHQTAPAGSASASAMNQNASQTSSGSASAPNPNQPAPASGSASAAAVKRTAKQVAGASAAPAIATAEGSASVPTANATATPASSSRGAPLLLVPATGDASARIPASTGHSAAPGPASATPAPANLTASAAVQLPNPPLPPAAPKGPRPGPPPGPPPPPPTPDPALPLQFASP